MSDIEWSDDDTITCPHCGEKEGDLWDYEWGNNEEIETECGSCGKPITIHQNVSVDYGVSKR